MPSSHLVRAILLPIGLSLSSVALNFGSIAPIALSATQRPRTQQTQPRKPAENRPLTNSDIVRMVKNKFGEDSIINTIQSNKNQFDLSVDALIELKNASVSERIIHEMQAAQGGGQAPQKPRSPAPPRPSQSQERVGGSTYSDGGGAGASRSGSYPLPPDKGAYLWDWTTLHLLYQTNVPSRGEHFWRKFVPFIHQKIELQLVGPRAKAHFDHNQPTILVSGLGEIIPGIPTFRWLYVKTGGMLKDRRIVGTYEIGGFFGSTQIVDNEIECDINKVKEGIYAITPRKPLPDGEYGLVEVPKILDTSARQSFSLPVWDFGIYAEGRPTDSKK